MGEITRGEHARSLESNIELVEIKKVRSQLKFALLMQMKVSTLQNREQDRPAPTGQPGLCSKRLAKTLSRYLPP